MDLFVMKVIVFSLLFFWKTRASVTEFQVSVVSDGCCCYTDSERLETLFFLNGSPICITWTATSSFYRRGFNFAVLNIPIGGGPQLESCVTFDTWLHVDEDSKMKQYMDGIPDGRMVLISVMDESTQHLSNSSRIAMQRFIKDVGNAERIGRRDSYAMVGYTKRQNECFPKWVTDARMPYDVSSNDAKSVRIEVTADTYWTC